MPGGEFRQNAFEDCTSLPSITLPSGVTSIGEYTFGGCTSLQSITLHKNLKSVGKYALTACKRVLVYGMATTLDRTSLNSDAVLYCYEYSAAWNQAVKYGWRCILMDGKTLDELDKYISMPTKYTTWDRSTFSLSYTVFPAPSSDTPQWTSSNPKVASVSRNGTITPLTNGQTVITLRIGDLSASCALSVRTHITDFALPWDVCCVIPNYPLQLKVINITPAGADDTLDWRLEDSDVASVDQNGLLTGHYIGSTVLTVQAANGLERSCEIRVCYPVTAVAFERKTLSLYPTERRALTANVSMRTQSCVNQLVSFTSSNPTVAEIDAFGVVTAKACGAAEITAAAINDSSISASCSVSVTDLPVLKLPKNVKIIKAEAFMNNVALRAVVIPAGAERIEAGAFKGCTGLRTVTIPSTVAFIAGDAFDGCTNLTICCAANSAAEAFAKEKKIPCNIVNN